MTLKQSDPDISVGETAPNFELESYNGEKVSLTDLDNFDGVLVIFMCNHCPYVKTQTDELRKLTEEFPSIAFVGVNPNTETHEDDSVEKMEKFVGENSLSSSNFYYLVDRDQEVAEQYGAVCTPDPFLLDWRHRLHYQGRLNDKTSPEEDVTEREMKNVIEDMLKRKDSPKEQKPSQGCSIKWRNQ